MQQNLKDLRNLDKDSLLDALGLQSKNAPQDYILPALGIFGVGFLVGTGLGILLAPRKGSDTRRQLRRQVSEVADKALAAAHS